VTRSGIPALFIFSANKSSRSSPIVHPGSSSAARRQLYSRARLSSMEPTKRQFPAASQASQAPSRFSLIIVLLLPDLSLIPQASLKLYVCVPPYIKKEAPCRRQGGPFSPNGTQATSSPAEHRQQPRSPGQKRRDGWAGDSSRRPGTPPRQFRFTTLIAWQTSPGSESARADLPLKKPAHTGYGTMALRESTCPSHRTSG
jgi:hypothetical protein